MTSITGPSIGQFQLLVWRQGIMLEQKGMKRSGRSCTAIVRDHFGLKGGTSREVVLSRLEEEIRKSEI